MERNHRTHAKGTAPDSAGYVSAIVGLLAWNTERCYNAKVSELRASVIIVPNSIDGVPPTSRSGLIPIADQYEWGPVGGMSVGLLSYLDDSFLQDGGPGIHDLLRFRRRFH